MIEDALHRPDVSDSSAVQNPIAAVRRRVGRALYGRIDRRVDEVLSELRETRAELRQTRDELAEAIRMLEIRHRRDLFYAGEVRAVRETELFVAANLIGVRTFPNPAATLRFACELVSLDGPVLEFGVAGGDSLRLLVECLPTHRLFGFDVFTGLPEHWRPGFRAGMFAQDAVPDIPGATLVPGLFEDTLPAFVAEHSSPIALLHLDADLYSSTVTVLEQLGSLLVPGSVVVLDEYFNFPGWQDGEFRAWHEFVERTGIAYRYEGYTFDNEQVVLTVTSTAR